MSWYKICPDCGMENDATSMRCKNPDCRCDIVNVPAIEKNAAKAEEKAEQGATFYKICPDCGAQNEVGATRCKECFCSLVNVISVSQEENLPEQETKEKKWQLISEDGQASLLIKNGESYDLGREHTLKEYLQGFSMVGRLQSRIYADNNRLMIMNLGRTNQTMADRIILWENCDAELHNDSRVILGRRPDDLGGYDDREHCAFFRVAELEE